MKLRPTETPGFLKTKDVLHATGITHQILYRYVTMGLVREYHTTESGHRLFSPETIAAIKLIRQLNQTGYTLRDIKDIFFKDRRIEQLRKRVEQVPAGGDRVRAETGPTGGERADGRRKG